MVSEWCIKGISKFLIIQNILECILTIELIIEFIMIRHPIHDIYF